MKPIGKYLGDLWKWKAQLDAEQQEKWDKRSLFTIGVLMGFLGSIILLMSWLTYEGKVSGDALLFVVGAVTSWILFAVQRYLFEPAPSEQEQKPFL